MLCNDLTIVYFSNVSENTHRFVKKLDVDSLVRIPVMHQRDQPAIEVETPFILVVPTYGDKRQTNYVPRQVIKFLNVESNRNRMVGVIATGNTNFGREYALSGNIIAEKCNVPHLYSLELMGTLTDVETTQAIIERLSSRTHAKIA